MYMKTRQFTTFLPAIKAIRNCKQCGLDFYNFRNMRSGAAFQYRFSSHYQHSGAL